MQQAYLEQVFMVEQIFSYLDVFENLLWGYVAVPSILILGLLLTVQSNFVQVRKFPQVVKTFFGFLKSGEGAKEGGIPPLKAFFACVGGCIGVGNIVGICTAVQLGGPGALFWIWVTAFAGMMLKYSEVYLGLRTRVLQPNGTYSGGPMYFLQKVSKGMWLPNLVAVLLCIYGVEVYQFSIVTQSLAANLHLPLYGVVIPLLILVMFAASGGVRRVGSISSAIIPFFVCLYVGMGLWVFINNWSSLPAMLALVLSSAFNGHAAVGGFVGSGIILAMSHGIRRGCYTTDVGVGYASVIHSESANQVAEKQASLVIFDIFIDTFMICTTSVALILVTGVWHQPMEAGMLVQTALSHYFPYMNFFMPLFLLLLGYNTINAYFCVGLKCAEFLAPRIGRTLYFVYAAAMLILFSFIDTTQAQTIMTIAGGLLLVINSYGIFRLRKEISFNIDGEEAKASLGYSL